MALLVTADEVKSRTSFQVVKDREPNLLADDILMAQMKLFKTCGHRFTDPVKYPTLPEEVRLALIKLAELYCMANTSEANVKGLNTEKIGDYSYSTFTGAVRTVSLLPLIEEHIILGGVGTKARLRFL